MVVEIVCLSVSLYVCTIIQTDQQTDKFCFFPDMPPGIKPSQGGSPPSLKVWSESNRDGHMTTGPSYGEYDCVPMIVYTEIKTKIIKY